MRLAEPAWLILLALAVLPWVGARLRPRLSWPTLGGFAAAPRAWAGPVRLLPPILRSLAIVCMAVALARPQTVGGRVRIAGRGVAIVVALDRSPSMAENRVESAGPGGPITRLEAARRTFAAFVRGRPDDLIGLVAFANFPDLACPPTLDHGFLIDVARALPPARPEESGTNIGDAIAVAADALLRSPPQQKVLVLLTDGDNEPPGTVPPPLDPVEAARLARALGVTVHTIGIGQAGLLRATHELTGLDVAIGETSGPNLDLLAAVARAGGGRMFAAPDADALAAVFRTLDALERSPVRGTIRTRYREWYPPWVAAAAALLALDRLLTAGRLRRLP